MEAYRLDGSGQINGLYRDSGPTPDPGPGEVLIRIGAASLNYLDLKILEGRFPLARNEGLVPLSDAAGEIVALGKEAGRWKIGDRVTSTFFPRWVAGGLSSDAGRDRPGATRDGMLAEFVIAHNEALVATPPHMSDVEASTLPCAALTAWTCLFEGARRLLPGETVLTQGSGGVSTFVIQLSKLAGARVVVTTSTSEKAQQLVRLGADHAIVRTDHPDWAAQVVRITAGAGADHLFEAFGALEQSLAAGGIGARLNMLGSPEGLSIDPGALMRHVVNIHRVTVGSRASFEAMNRALYQYRLRPVVDQVFAFADARDAYQHLRSGGHLGKIVIAMPQP